MPEVEKVYVCYVGDGLGAEPRTHLRGGLKKVHWNRYDRRVQLLHAEEAASLLRTNPEDFRLCSAASDFAATPSAQGAGLTVDRLVAMGGTGEIHIETYRGKGGDEEVPVVVLDEVTAAGIDLAGRARQLAETGEDETGGLRGGARRASRRNAGAVEGEE